MALDGKKLLFGWVVGVFSVFVWFFFGLFSVLFLFLVFFWPEPVAFRRVYGT